MTNKKDRVRQPIVEVVVSSAWAVVWRQQWHVVGVITWCGLLLLSLPLPTV